MMLLPILWLAAIPSAEGGAPLDTQLIELIRRFELAPLDAPAPEDPALYDLGRRLFFEPALSGNRDISCASCHSPERGLGDGRSLSIGTRGRTSPRNAPPLDNVGHPDYRIFFRDGRVQYFPEKHEFRAPLELPAELRAILSGGLSAQALFPLLNPDEMLGRPEENEVAALGEPVKIWAALALRITSEPEYRRLLKAAYPNAAELTVAHLTNAIAAFIAAEYSATDTPYDRYLRGDRAALTAPQKEGFLIFLEKGRCAECHRGPLLSDQLFHAVAAPQLGPGVTAAGDDLGVFPDVVADTRALYHFKTPPLRNIARTGPYMHDGAFATLAQVIEHYADIARSQQAFFGEHLAEPKPAIDGNRFRMALRLQMLPPPLRTPLSLDARDKELLLNFLETALADRRASL